MIKLFQVRGRAETGLRKLRHEAGLTLKRLAGLSGVNYMKIHQIETGKINPENMALKTAEKLSKALNCSHSDLLESEETSEDAPE